MMRKIAVGAALMCALTLAHTGVANAALPTVYVNSRTGGGEVRASATYRDSTDKFCVQDEYTDDHSGVVQYKRQGSSWGSAFEVWDHSTNDGVPACVVAAFAENAPLVMRVCVGEWAPSPARRVILRDADGGPWCGAAKTIRA